MRILAPFALFALVLSAAATAQDDGPYLFHHEKGVVAKWIVKGKVHTKEFAAGKPIALPAFEALLGKQVELVDHKPQPASWKLPERVLVISDIEGEYDNMFAFLRGNGVIDEHGRWKFGKGHLVTVGDMVDRGSKQTEVLWMLWRLQREAQAAGGQVHYVLGNHEIMLMGGDVRYTAPKYAKTAELLELPVEGLVGADTELGRWLRARNSLVRIGPFLFVHAGVSPVAARAKIDLDKLNEFMRKHIGVPPDKIEDAQSLAWLWTRPGPMWYRGYFAEFALEFGPVPTVEQMDQILTNLGAKSIVIGHTKVEKVTVMFGERRVIAIDIPWNNLEAVRGLSIRGESVEVVDFRGKSTPLE